MRKGKTKTMTNQHKLTRTMKKVLEQSINAPIGYFGTNRQTIDALIGRGLLEKKYKFGGFYCEITPAGVQQMGASQVIVELNYAGYWLNNGSQIRHNCKQVKKNSYIRDEYLDYEYFQRSLDKEIDAVADWMQRAIELTRAEIRAGIAR